jgi:PAS domain S-box-containing protein
MTYFQIVGYPLLLVAAMEIILGGILLRHNPHNSPINKSVAAFSFFSAGYSLFSSIIYLRTALGLDIDLVARANWIGWFSIPAALQFLYFMRDERNRTARIIGYILYPFWTVIYALCIFTDLVEPTGYSLLPPVDHQGPLENPARLAGGLLILWVLYEVIVLRKQVRGVKREQLNYFFHGTLIFGAGAALLAAFMQLFGRLDLNPELGAYFSFPWVLLTFYAVMRYSLFDIRAILARTLSIVLIWLGFATVHIWLTTVLEPSFGHNFALLTSLSFIGFVFFGTPVSKWVQQWTQRIIVKGRYDYQQILKESFNAIITILDQNELLTYIIESIRRSMGIQAVYLYWRSPSGRYTRRQGFGPLLDSGDEMALADVAVQWLRQERQPVMRKELETIMPGEGSGGLTAYMRKIGLELMIPMVYKGEFQGILALGEKGNREPYVRSDIDLLETLAGHAAVAIENARLYEEARRVEESLHESEEKFRTLAQTLPAAIFIHRGGKFLYANPAATRMTGYSMEELLRMDFWGVTHPDYRQIIMSRGRGRLQGDQPPSQYEFKIARKDGESRWVLMTVGTIEYGGQGAVIGTIYDITESKQAEEEKARLYEENVRQYRQRIQEEERHQREKEKILRDLHDGIGGITTNISLLAEMAKESKNLPEIKKTLTTISALAREGLADIRGFMHSLDAGDMSWHSLVAELRRQGSSMIESHGMSFLLTSSLDGSTQTPGSLFCLNLFKIYKESLVNIFKHSRAKSVVVNLDIESDKLMLLISDDGIGFGEKTGAGRGVSNMKARTKELGGEMSILSGNGTTIRVELPLPKNYPMRAMEI